MSVGFDIEPQAITSAKNNAALNDIGPDKLMLSLVPSINSPHFENEFQNENSTEHDPNNSKIIFVKEKYDVVIANILLYPLLVLADHIVSYAMPGAIVGISGIISEQERGILKEATLERRATPMASQNESSNPSTLGGKLQMTQRSDNQRWRSTTTIKQQNHRYSVYQEPKQMTSPLKCNTTQRLEKFRKIASPIQPQGNLVPRPLNLQI